jgi:hypothetical protein
MNDRHPRDIPVKFFRTTFYWPLALDLPPSSDKAFWTEARLEELDVGHILHEQIDLLCKEAPWEDVEDTLEHVPEPKRHPDDHEGKAHQAAMAKHHADAYAEYAFFHDFIQRFQFTKPAKSDQSSSAPFRLLRRSDITSVEVTLDGGSVGTRRFFQLTVDRLSLYVYRMGVAVLVLEVSSTEKPCLRQMSATDVLPGVSVDVSLADVMQLNNRMRRAHAPFIVAGKEEPFEDELPLSFVPTHVRWIGGMGMPDAPFSLLDDIRRSGDKALPIKQRLRTMEKHEREIPPFRHWSSLLQMQKKDSEGKPQTVGWAIAPAQANGATWRHVTDERLPILATIELENHADYRAISEGNWMRLCFVDGPGSDRFPYAQDFVEKNWSLHTYDRYHYKPGETSEPSNRYLMCSYALTAVGSGDFFEDNIRMHMRRHYFQLMLLAQLELAVMLGFSSRITLAISDYEEEVRQFGLGGAEAKLETRLHAIEREFLHYVHRFRFTGLSNQLQPSEMFSQLRSVMGLDAIYNDLKEELTTATEFMFSRSDQRRAVSGERLNVIATLGVVFGLAMSFLGLQVLMTPEHLASFGILPKNAGPLRHIAVVAGVFGAFAGGGWALSWCLPGARRERSPMSIYLRRLLLWTGLAGLGIAAMLWFVDQKRTPSGDDKPGAQACVARDGAVPCPAPSGSRPAATP